MPLVKAVFQASLKSSLEAALVGIESSIQESDDPSVTMAKIADELATAISDATDTYIKSATITIPIGAVTTGASPGAIISLLPIPVDLA